MAKRTKVVTALGNENKVASQVAFVAYRNGAIIATANTAEAAKRISKLNPNIVFVQVAETPPAPLGESQPQGDTSEQ